MKKRRLKKPAEQPVLPPIDGEDQREAGPSRLKAFLKSALTVLITIVTLALAYVFLLLGEPDAATGSADPAIAPEPIRVPMAAIEVVNAAELPLLMASFGEPVLYLTSGLALERATLGDTAFAGGYARRATLAYSFADGSRLTMESIRPSTASALIGAEGYSLRVGTPYALAGMDAARMDSANSICILAKGKNAVYAMTFPTSHRQELNALLRASTLMIGVDNQ